MVTATPTQSIMNTTQLAMEILDGLPYTDLHAFDSMISLRTTCFKAVTDRLKKFAPLHQAYPVIGSEPAGERDLCDIFVVQGVTIIVRQSLSEILEQASVHRGR